MARTHCILGLQIRLFLFQEPLKGGLHTRELVAGLSAREWGPQPLPRELCRRGPPKQSWLGDVVLSHKVKMSPQLKEGRAGRYAGLRGWIRPEMGGR